MENTIRVLKVEPGKAPYEKEIVDDYKVSQSEVGGDIDCFDTGDGCVEKQSDRRHFSVDTIGFEFHFLSPIHDKTPGHSERYTFHNNRAHSTSYRL